LFINSTDIEFNSTAPTEGSNITISAVVKNIGYTTAYNFVVNFYDGNPSRGGTKINGDKVVSSLESGTNVTLNVTWIATLDLHEIWVIADAQGNVTEINELNNNASRNITIPVWHYVAGNTTGDLDLEDLTARKVYSWNMSNYTTTNIFAADTDSNVKWGSLLAMGRNSTNETNFNDFADIDSAMNMSNFTDNVNKSFTSGGSAKELRNMTIFGRTVYDIPIVNSTNTSAFITGILWDSNDTNPGVYNGTQDLVFVTQAGDRQQGAYGYYDFEIRVPARLREYIKPNNYNSITFYVEIK
jgi:hypothetical protein